MRADFKERRRRVVIIKMLLEWLNLIHATENAEARQVFIHMMVRLGVYEGRMMDISDIAEVTRLSRATVARHLAELERKDEVKMVKVGRRVVASIVNKKNDEADAYYDRMKQLIEQAARDLSKMDT